MFHEHENVKVIIYPDHTVKFVCFRNYKIEEPFAVWFGSDYSGELPIVNNGIILSNITFTTKPAGFQNTYLCCSRYQNPNVSITKMRDKDTLEYFVK